MQKYFLSHAINQLVTWNEESGGVELMVARINGMRSKMNLPGEEKERLLR